MNMIYTKDNFKGFKVAVIASQLAELKSRASRGAYAKKRYETALRLAEKPNDGTIGCLAELLAHAKDSTITAVRKQGRPDFFATINGRRERCEYKSNGGRIEDLYRLASLKKAHYVVYELVVCNSGTGYVGRIVKPLLFEVHDFIARAEAIGAVQIVGGSRPQDKERNLNRTSVKLYEMLERYGEETGLWYDPDREYTITAGA